MYQLYVSARQTLLRMSQTLAFAKLASHKLISVALLVRLALIVPKVCLQNRKRVNFGILISINTSPGNIDITSK